MAKQIIWIDDDYYALGVLVEPLKEMGFQIRGIRTLGDAIDEIETIRRADLILLDVILPSGDIEPERKTHYLGLELLKRFEHEKIEIPILILSVVQKPEILHEAEQFTNVKAIIDKNPTPDHVDDLERKVTELFPKPHQVSQ